MKLDLFWITFETDIFFSSEYRFALFFVVIVSGAK